MSSFWSRIKFPEKPNVANEAMVNSLVSGAWHPIGTACHISAAGCMVFVLRLAGWRAGGFQYSRHNSTAHLHHCRPA